MPDWRFPATARARRRRPTTIAVMSNSRLVYSTDDGDQPARAGARSRRKRNEPGDGIVRVCARQDRPPRQDGHRRPRPPRRRPHRRRERPETPLRHRRHGQGRHGRTARRPPREGRRPPTVAGLPGEARGRVTCPKVESSANRARRGKRLTWASFALLAQLVEHLHGKEGVNGSSPLEGSKSPARRGFLLSRLL